jgi:hypothetical protein
VDGGAAALEGAMAWQFLGQKWEKVVIFGKGTWKKVRLSHFLGGI